MSRRLEATEAAADYWRSVATDRRAEAARVQHRPLVRAAIAIDRRTRPFQDRALSAARRGRDAANRLRATATRGLGPAPTPRSPSSNCEATLDVTLVELTPDQDPTVGDEGSVLVAMGPGVEPRPGWLTPLVAALDDPAVVAAVPCSLLRSGAQVRSAGARVELIDDAPVALALAAPSTATAPVDLAAGRVIAVRRDDWLRVGGITAVGDVEASIIDLGLRLAASGSSIVSVRDAAVIDERRPARPVEVHQRPASDTAAWSDLVDDHGATLRRLAIEGDHPARTPARWSVMVTTATPSRKIAAHSGDWHYAGLFVDALHRAGLDAVRQPINEAGSNAGRSRDLHVVLRGLEPVERTLGQRHVLWVISHPEALTAEECDAADLVLVASERFADHVASLTTTPVEVFEQATDPTWFRPEATSTSRSATTVVANTRGVRRASVDAALAAGHRPRIYGLGWDGLVDQDLVVAPYVAFADLPAVYAASAVVLNDHWETMRHWGFVSNRILDATAAGAVVISDHLPELTERFDGLIPTWKTPSELGQLLDAQAADPTGFAARAAQARDLVLGAHTFDHRVRELDELLRRHGLHPAS